MDSRIVIHRKSGVPGRRRSLKPALACLLAALVCGQAWAHGGGPRHHGFGHHRHGGASIGLFVGAPLWYGYGDGPGWYGDPYFRYRYDMQAPAEPPVYVERGAPAPAMWYFCANPQGYYPYVKQCATDWRAVAPQSVIR